MSTAKAAGDAQQRRGSAPRPPSKLAPWRWNWPQFVRADPTRLLDDVFARPSVAPLAAWFVSGLIGAVAWLAARYAAGVAARETGPGLHPAASIPEDAGRLTILAVAALALLAGWAPVIARRFGRTAERLARPVIMARNWYVAWPRDLLCALAFIVWRAPSIVLSFIDWLLVRPIAVLAGVRVSDLASPAASPWFRYAILAFWMAGSAFAAMRLSAHVEPGLAPSLALWALAPGFLAAFGVMRRWMWVERDRAAFLIERGGPAHKRIGFQEDLRDEALTAMIGLLALIPIALHEINLATDAFVLLNANGAPVAGEPTLWQWTGFFGAELAKTIPFIDWSDVFHIANGSPIRPRDGLGATLVFALRAGLDFLLLAAALQAVLIGARVRDQKAAFRAGKLSILDPFAELVAFRALARRKLDRPILRRLADAVADFPGPYDERRLAEIVAGRDAALKALIARDGKAKSNPGSLVERDPDARDAAMLVLAGQHPASKMTERVLSVIAAGSRSDEARRSRVLMLLAESNPAAAEQPLLDAAADENAAPNLRVQALRDLGWLRRRGGSDVLSALLADVNADPLLRIHAGLVLVKTARADEQIIEAIKRLLALSLKRDDARATMSSAYALWSSVGANAVGKSAQQPLVARVLKSVKGECDRMASIPAGAFLMGAGPGERGAFADEHPRREIAVAAFEIGVYAVTFDEYDHFCGATGQKRPPDARWGRDGKPVIQASWDDADAYCEWLNAWTGERFRLPSESEWEYACRAGTTTPFHFGETISTQQANYDGGYAYANGPKGERRHRPTKVGSFPASAFGLYDMHGNVWEWCADVWRDNYQYAPRNGAAYLAGDSDARVLRGGSWTSPPDRLRSASRFKENPAHRSNDIGFRLARSIAPR